MRYTSVMPQATAPRRIHLVLTRGPKPDHYEVSARPTVGEQAARAVDGRDEVIEAARTVLTAMFARGDTVEFAGLLFTNVDDAIQAVSIALERP